MQNKKFSQKYYITRYKKGIFSKRGDKHFFYSYWKKYLTKRRILSFKTKLLDYGCGEGFWLKRISPYLEAYGSDLSEYALGITQKRVKNVGIKLAKGEEIPFIDNFFDVITSFDVIEHSKNPEKLISEFYRILKHNGTAIISTPNLFSWGKIIKGDEWHGVQDKTHINMKTINEWNKIFLDKNFRVIKFGTDLFWDTPYLKFIPSFLQKLIFVGINNLFFIFFGFTSFKYGENAYFILKKK